MRALLVNHSRSATSMGGAERSVLALGDAWRAADPSVEIEVVTVSADGAFADEVSSRGWPLVAVDFAPWALPEVYDDGETHYRSSRRDDAAVLALVEHLRATNPDVVLTNSLVNPWAAVAAGITGTPHVWFVREFGTLDHGLSFTLGESESWADVGLLSDLIVANSEAVRAHAAAFLPGRDILVAYPTIDADADADAAGAQVAGGEAATQDDADAELRLVLVGSIRPAKQQLLAVQALAGLHDRGIPARLTLAGPADDEEYTALLLAEAERRGVADRLELTGYLDHTAPVVRAADVGLMLSRHEAFGRVTLEYSALGRPTVGLASGGTRELIVDGVTGRLVEVGTADPSAEGATVTALVDALAGYAADRVRLTQHGEAARAGVAEIAGRHPLAPVLTTIAEFAATSPRRPKLPHLVEYWLSLAPSVEKMNAGWDEIRRELLKATTDEYDGRIQRLTQQKQSLELDVARAKDEIVAQRVALEAEIAPLREFFEYSQRHQVAAFPIKARRALARRLRR